MIENIDESVLVGESIGNYVITKLLGTGGMGAVYLAEHPRIGRQVAVKVLAAHLSHLEGIADRFVMEARTVARIDHPNVVTIYDFGQIPQGQPYYIMELLKGRELRAVMEQRGPMTPLDMWPYVQQICAALQAAHDHGVIHRDLKPENIFVLDKPPDGVKVLDFGIAKLLEPDPKAPMATMPGLVVGTPQYMAPEQAAGLTHRICRETDIYALGVVLYQMLSGRLPFQADTQALIMAMHIRDAPPPLRAIKPDVSEPMAALIEQCLDKDPARRPGSATEFADEFAAICGASPIYIPLAPSPTPITGVHLSQLPPVAVEAAVVPSFATVDVPAAPTLGTGGHMTLEALGSAGTIAAPITAQVSPVARPAPTPVSGPQSDPVVVQRVIEALLTQMRRQGDLPPVVEVPGEKSTKTPATGLASATEMTRTVFEDYPIARKLLKMVNATYHQRYGGRIRSISRAVVMIGFEQVRTAAAGLTLFPEIRDRNRQDLMADEAICSLTTALLSQQLATRCGLDNHEEAFICGLFQQIGAHLVLHYLPNRYDDICARGRQLTQYTDYNDRLNAAAQAVLGASFEAIAVGVAQRWQLPTRVQQSLKRRTDAELSAPSADETIKLFRIVALSDAVATAIATQSVDTSPNVLSTIIERYGAGLRLEEVQLRKMIQSAARTILDQYSFVPHVNLKQCRYFKKALAWGATKGLEASSTAEQMLSGDSYGLDTTGLGTDIGGDAQSTVLRSGIQAMKEAIERGMDVNQILNIMLDTIYRGLSFPRVLFFFVSPDRQSIIVRAGRGDGVDALIGKLALPIAALGSDFFSEAVHRQKDAVCERSRDPQLQKRLPSWYATSLQREWQAESFVLYPIAISMKTVALIYADGASVPAGRLQYMDKLRNQAVAALRARK